MKNKQLGSLVAKIYEELMGDLPNPMPMPMTPFSPSIHVDTSSKDSESSKSPKNRDNTESYELSQKGVVAEEGDTQVLNIIDGNNEFRDHMIKSQTGKFMKYGKISQLHL